MSSKHTVLLLEGSREGLSRLLDLHRQGGLSMQLGVPVFGLEETGESQREGVTFSSETVGSILDAFRDRGNTGRWLVPGSAGLPALILMDPGVREQLCGYPVGRDCLNELTAMELIRVSVVDAAESQGHPVLRQLRSGDKVIYAISGRPKQVAAQIRKMVRSHGLRMASVLIPERPVDKVSFYIVGARWLRRAEGRQDEHGEGDTSQSRGDK